MAPVLAVALLGCAPARTDEMLDRITRLEARVEARRAEVDKLRQTLARAARPWHRDPPTLPEGFDPERPLPAAGERPDILLLSIDTLRADHLGTYGYERDTSPFVDRLAREGTRYDDFWSPSSWTLPSHTTMLSGLLPDRHGAIEDSVTIGASVPLLQETLRDVGYRTAGVTSTLFVSRRFGFDRGFDYFYDFEITSPGANNRGVADAEEVFAEALHWAQRQPDGAPLFLFLHVYDVHYTYNAPAPFDTRFDRAARLSDARYRNYQHYKRRMLDDAQLAHQIAQYDEEIAYVDAQLEALVKRWWTAERPLVVAVTSDHGEEFGERGSWGHAHTLYPEQLHVPFVVHGPGVARQTVQERAGTADIASTLAALAGADHPTGDGVNRATQLGSGGRAGASNTYAETSRFETLQLRMHDAGLDLVVDARRGTTELYDLRADPGARVDLARSRPADVERLTALLSERLGTPWTPREASTVRTGKGGVLWRDGIRGHRAELGAGEGFAVLPLDVGVSVLEPRRSGPFNALEGTLPPSDGPLVYTGPRFGDVSTTLSDSEIELLEELGYIQD